MQDFKYKIRKFLSLIFRSLLIEKCFSIYTQGKSHENFLSKLVPTNDLYNPGTIRNVEREGISYELDLYDMVDWWIYFGFKNPIGSNMYPSICEGDTFIDVGANNGEVSLKAARKVGNSGRVIAFEPNPKNINRFKKNIALNSFDNITLVELGVGNEAGEFQLNNDTPENLGMGWIGNPSDDKSVSSILIKVTSLDDYLLSMELNSVDFIKIDVEGFEINVLEGAKGIIKKFQPTLFVEVEDTLLNRQGTSASELISLIREFNYQPICSGTGQVVTSDSDFEVMMDVLAIPKKN